MVRRLFASLSLLATVVAVVSLTAVPAAGQTDSPVTRSKT